MNLFGGRLEINLRKASKKEISGISAYTGGYPAFLQSRSVPMLLSTVYRCVDLISTSIAVLPLETYRRDADGFKRLVRSHPIYDILDLEPNENMTRHTFFKTLMASVLLQGNGYAYIERDSGLNVQQIHYLPPQSVSIVWIMDRYGIRRKRYRVSGFGKLVEPRDMIHVLNFSYDGIIGISTLSHARQTLDIATTSEEQAANFLHSRASSAGVLAVENGRLTRQQKDEIYETWDKRTNTTGIAPIVVLEANMKYQPISISPKDSQLLESRQFNVVDICRFFSVSPVKAFDLTKSSYSTVEATQLDYLTDTALSVITKIEQEINRKVFLPSDRAEGLIAEFNTSGILRTDKAAQAGYWKDMFNIGAATPNEIRRENNLSRMDNGDKAFVQVNVQTLDNAVNTPRTPADTLPEPQGKTPVDDKNTNEDAETGKGNQTRTE